MAERGRARTQGIAGTWPPREAARAGGFAPSGFSTWSSFAAKLREWIRAEAGAGRLLPWVPVAFGTGIAFYFAADHEPVLPVAAADGGGALPGGISAAAAEVISRCGDDRRGRRGLCHRDLEDGADRAWRAGTADVRRVAVGLCRDPRHPRAHRSFCAARHVDGKPALTDKTGARPAVGAQGHRARGRQLRRIEGAAAAAAVAVAAGQLRFRPRHVFSGHRRLRFCHRRDQDRGAAGERRAVAALRRLHAGSARCDRCADPHDARWRQARDRDRAADRPPRRHHDAGQRRHVHLRPRPRAVDIGLSHGGRRRRGVLRGARAAGADPRLAIGLSDQEMVGGGSARRGAVLSAAVGRRSRHPALVLHDGGGADRGHGRPPRGHLPHARGRGDDRAGDRAGSAGASELPDVVCGNARPGGAGADRHAPPVCRRPTIRRPRRSRCGAGARS